VVRRSGLPVKTIRFYCDQGLLRPVCRSDGGYRLFIDDNLAELAPIRSLCALDVPLEELARILDVRRAGISNCTHLNRGNASKMAAIDERIHALQGMKTELARLLDSWQDCGGAPLEAPQEGPVTPSIRSSIS
jgi:DNA-binding transcriptional MerR regulator